MFRDREMLDSTIYGDVMDSLRLIPSNSVNLIITSPPYNLGMSYDGAKCNDTRPWADYFLWCRFWLNECWRVLRHDGRMCLNHYLSCGDAERGRVAPLMTLNEIATSKEIGFKHHGVAIWNDATVSRLTAWGSWLSASSPYVNSPYEGILLLYKEHWKREHKGTSTIGKDQFIEGASGVWKLRSMSRKKANHPAAFSLDLPMMCINLLSYVDDVVLDPFVGTGTTSVAAMLAGRRYIGIDSSEKYCRMTERRLKEAKLCGTDPVGQKRRPARQAH